MKKQARMFEQMQLEEARAESGRYWLADPDAPDAQGDPNPLWIAFERARLSLGLGGSPAPGAAHQFRLSEDRRGR